MNKQEELKKWAKTLKKFNDSIIELFDITGKDILNEAYLRAAVEMLVDILQTKYGALALLGESQHFSNFIHVGVSEEQAARIGHLPEGKGLLGIVIKENKTLNVEDISEDSRSCGFPPHHPQMKSLLAAPVAYKDQIYGRIYLCDKKSGELFTKQDEKLLSGFAHLLGLIIRNKNESDRISLLNKELVTVARQAGMAEVSVSILHNMGNMLNSLNVSAQVLQEKVQQLKIEELTTLSTLLQVHSNELGLFFTENKKGKCFVEYLNLFYEQLKNSKTYLLNEIKNLNNDIEHIKNTVTMYQSMGKKFSLVEPVLIEKIFETILSLHKGILTSYPIAININNTIAFPVELDRMKLEQILINLISNAIESLTSSENRGKQLTLSAFPEKDMICIQITDNGVGISEEHLKRIFNFGFTTKIEGRGFSLHTSALAAQEMGGSLIASSEGLDKGATFTLKIPLNKGKLNNDLL